MATEQQQTTPFDRFLVDFLHDQKASFHLSDVVGYLQSKQELAEECHLRERVLEHPEILASYFCEEDSEDPVFISRADFFQDVEFRMTPLPEEIEQGILFPGHRFIPFCSDEIYPFDFVLQENKTPLKMRTIKKTINDVIIYHRLFPPHDMLFYYSENHPDNMGIMENNQDALINMRVYDMAEFYRRHHFQVGDSLVVTVQDWITGVYSIRYSPSDEMCEEFTACRPWCEELDRCLKRVIEKNGVMTEVHDQLADAYFMSGDTLKSYPGFALGPYLSKSKLFDIITPPIGTTILWPKGKEVDADLEKQLDEGLGSIGTGRTDSLDAILLDIGLITTEAELEARMRNELFNGGQSSDPIFDTLTNDGDRLVFVNEQQHAAFYIQVEELWENIVAEYNEVTDAVAGPIRAHYLGILDQQIAWMRELDRRGVPPSCLSTELMFAFSQLSAILHQVLLVLNAPEQCPSDEMHRLGNSADELTEKSEQLIQRMEEAIPENLPVPVERDTAQIEKLDQIIYQLKITLQYSKPPIWRRLQVPSSLPLSELHLLIQLSFGWMNGHLHSFTCDGETYGPLQEDDDFFMSDSFDEADTLLADVMEMEKDKISYTYDFGDDWTHQIVLEKILPRSAGKNYPTCTAGKQACPPEDCGGMGGYERMLDILTDPENPEYNDMMEWLGDDFNPTFFSKKMINEILNNYWSEL